RLVDGAETIGRKLVEHVEYSEAQLSSRANVIAETFGAVNRHIGERTQEAADTFDAHTRQLNEMLAARTSEMSRVLDEQARPIADRIAETGEELQRGIQQTTEAATARLRSENAALVNALSARTNETLSAVEAAREGLAGGVT